jgi:hypothetical protein
MSVKCSRHGASFAKKDAPIITLLMWNWNKESLNKPTFVIPANTQRAQEPESSEIKKLAPGFYPQGAGRGCKPLKRQQPCTAGMTKPEFEAP